MTHTKEKPTAEKIMSMIEGYGNWQRAYGANTNPQAQEAMKIGRDSILSEIRVAIIELVNNQK